MKTLTTEEKLSIALEEIKSLTKRNKELKSRLKLSLQESRGLYLELSTLRRNIQEALNHNFI